MKIIGGSARSVPLNGFVLPYRERRRLHNRAFRAQQRNQSEVCGLVLASKRNKLCLKFLPNRSSEAGEYRLERRDARFAARAARRSDCRVLGTFHSHPISEAIPSRGDVERGFFYGYELIYDVCGLRARLWRLRRGAMGRNAEEVHLLLEPRPKARKKPTSVLGRRRTRTP